jgi:hypothetical protein
VKPYLEKILHKKGLVEWLQAKALGSNSSTAKKKKSGGQTLKGQFTYTKIQSILGNRTGREGDDPKVGLGLLLGRQDPLKSRHHSLWPSSARARPKDW